MKHSIEIISLRRFPGSSALTRVTRLGLATPITREDRSAVKEEARCAKPISRVLVQASGAMLPKALDQATLSHPDDDSRLRVCQV